MNIFQSSNSFGSKFIVTDAGESHGKGYVTIIEGCPAGISLNEEDLWNELKKRRPGKSDFESSRDEKDKPEILSGVFEGKTLGTPICVLVKNENQESKDYSNLKDKFRPGHADYTYFLKHGFRDHRGGGRSSARQTLTRIIGGVVAKKVLESKNIDLDLLVFLSGVGPVKYSGTVNELDSVLQSPLEITQKFKDEILKAKENNNSIGSEVKIIVKNLPKGLGNSFYGSLKAILGYSFLSLPAIQAIEFGSGINASSMLGSEHNDQMINVNGKIRFESNNHGGILGGISSGNPIEITCHLKPPSSISQDQKSVNTKNENINISINGRHDPCLGARFCPIARAMIYITFANLIL